MKLFKFKSIQWQLTIAILAIIIISVGVITAFTAIRLSSVLEAAGKDYAGAVAERESAAIQSELNAAMETADVLATAFSGVKDTHQELELSRDDVNAMLVDVLDANQDYFGIYTLWEPNAFDGMDDQYVGLPGSFVFGRNVHGQIILRYLLSDFGHLGKIGYQTGKCPSNITEFIQTRIGRCD